MLSEQPKAGRERPELAPGLRSFPVGNYLLFYLPLPGGIDLVRVLSGYMDIGADTSRPNRLCLRPRTRVHRSPSLFIAHN